MNRAQSATLVFAALVAAVIVGTAFVAYQGVRGAFEREFAQRLQQLAELSAAQVSAADLADARQLGPDGDGLLALQLDALGRATGLANVAVLDDSGRVVYDVREGFARAGLPSRYDSLAHATIERARAGASAALPAYRDGAIEMRAAVTPLHDAPGVVLVTEDAPRWAGQLARLRRDLALLAAVAVLAVAALAALLLRATASQLSLERRLSRSENLAAMGRMTATLAHEIKNPLAIIRGSAKRLGKLDTGAQAMADSVVEEVDRLSATVNRYLQFARGGPAADDARGDAAATLAATLDLLRGEFEARGCTCVREDALATASVPLEDGSLKQVWLNLLQNALEALGPGGQVRVSCERTGAHVRVRVADNGPGVSAAVVARMGEPFYTTRAQGTGLGLFLSRQLVQGAGGTLEIASREGHGTTVTVEFPALRADA
ncbi:MAG: ATP-binding protein [Candidatus Eisenbacteria bacterium]